MTEENKLETVQEEPTVPPPTAHPQMEAVVETPEAKKEPAEKEPTKPSSDRPPQDEVAEEKPAVEKSKEKSETKGNPLRKIKIEKITLNVGAGKNEEMLKKGLKLLEKLSPVKPVKTVTKKRIPGWGLRPGLAIGCMVTIRKDCEQLLKRLLVAKENILKENNFDNQGNFSFGIPEYIDIEGLDYDPELKIMGLEVAVTLERPGFRVKKKKIRSGKIGKTHQISKEEAISFMQKFGVEIE